MLFRSIRDNYQRSQQKSPKYKYAFDDIKNNMDAVTFDDIPAKEPVFSQDVSNNVASWEVGDIVIHEKFGRGVVKSLEGDNIIVVDFNEHGEKTLLGTHRMIKKGTK